VRRKNGEKTAAGRFAPGNPGRPKGAKNKTTRAVEELMVDEAEAIGRKCIEKALEGDGTALRLVMERIAPVRRGRPVRFAMPQIQTAADLSAALGAVVSAVAAGELTVDEAVGLGQLVETRRRAIETVEIEQRVAALEQVANR
jgi:uncharacterized protein DUF5681